MDHETLVLCTLEAAGFRVTRKSNGLMVWLNNRTPSTSDVQMALKELEDLVTVKHSAFYQHPIVIINQ